MTQRRGPFSGSKNMWAWLSTATALALVLVLLTVLGGTESDTDPVTLSSTPSPGPWQPVATAGTSATPESTPVVPPADPATAPSWMRKLNPGEKPPQFVLFSFDGAGSTAHWARVLPLAKRSGAHVTALLSGIYLLENSRKNEYTGPGHPRGSAEITFGGTRQEVVNRIGYFNQAIADGHEIGTHYNGHFCQGAEPSVGFWSTQDWNSEMDQFNKFVEVGRQLGLRLDPTTIRGGRTPCLEHKQDQLFPAMLQHGLVYDTSQVTLGVQWPKVKQGVWEFAMPEVRIPALNSKVVMMDFNLWYALNGAQEQPERKAEFSQITLDTYRSVYNETFNGNRAPLVIGNHFNEWAGGAFGDAVERFMGEVCVKTDTVCATYTEVMQWMQLQDPAVLQEFRNMPAAMN
ncbi:polysaccharide deacetylase family protein [Goodfellowiella coeruleoviolacea]|uniref:Polysaccharide deacetylase n=1 Tax=Goodfellowiella coeruleoviolacea TaxID=334858 RepID=A0AAE3KEV7_9PSEU|nr:polysaccharide deacetylase [Goodfellowiella coeruleoviolacea]MCP2165711.1 hypothetical protein [Goodfellowiella coeruleoviolacea]